MNRKTLPQAAQPAESHDVVTVAMMRHGDKLASYRIIAEALACLSGQDWHLNVVGDGPARDDVEELFRPFGDKVRFLGRKSPEAVAQIYGQSALLLWPGVNEAFGMVYLEAQAAGLPVVAQNRPGVRDVLAPGPHPGP